MSPRAGPLPPGSSRGALVAEVAARLESVPRGASVIVACSGGPDSVALAHLTFDARPDLSLLLVHVHHGLRDDRHERALVHLHAGWLEAEAVDRDVEVAATGHGLQAAARDARYAALREVAAERRAAAILVGHTADDQAETVVLRLARGTGVDGLAAMAVVDGDLVRPLLHLPRSDVHGFVELDGLPVAADPSNVDPRHRRVRVRRRVLPTLAEIGPEPVAALARLADLARDDAAALDDAAVRLDAQRRVGPVHVLERTRLAAAPIAVSRRVVRRALTELVGTAPTAESVAIVLDTAAGGGATLPGGVHVAVDAAWITLCVAAATPSEVRGLIVPGETSWPPAGIRLHAHRPGADQPRQSHAGQIAFDLPGAWSPPPLRVGPAVVPPGGRADRLRLVLPAETGPLVVRTLRAGDRLRTAVGHRRVVDVLREAGMPVAVRRRWPLVANPTSVVWVPAIAADEPLLRGGRTAPGMAIDVVAQERT